MKRCVSLSAGPLCVRFQSVDDRLSHSIGILSGEAFVPFLESIEGSSSDAWPQSPPMQQMVEEHIGSSNQPVLFGVGLSGNGHWSMAIDSPSESVLKFDIACKISKSATRLGSNYRLLVDSSMQTSHGAPSQQRLVLCNRNETSNDKASKIELKMLIGCLQASQNELVIVPAESPDKIQTHRWCFQIALSSTAD